MLSTRLMLELVAEFTPLCIMHKTCSVPKEPEELFCDGFQSHLSPEKGQTKTDNNKGCIVTKMRNSESSEHHRKACCLDFLSCTCDLQWARARGFPRRYFILKGSIKPMEQIQVLLQHDFVQRPNAGVYQLYLGGHFFDNLYLLSGVCKLP